MKRPDVKSILKPLKPFQRRTVEHAFERLFVAPDSTGRFLVADEVGLGKTLVARGIIAKTIAHLWDEVDRIDIIYICSNQSIARANLPKLQVTGEQERSFALATRLTMLATELAPGPGSPGIINSKVNFVSFTPSTSFDMGHAGGKADERRVLFHLLEPLVDRRKGLMNLLQAGVTRTMRWRRRLKREPLPLEPAIARSFRKAFERDGQLRQDVDEAIDTWFGQHQKRYPREAKRFRNRILGELRTMLAKICIDALQPDLVILDEFQRFKSLLEHREELRDPAAELAQALFRAETPEGETVRTLLLSATPYKLYTTDAEIEHEDHYTDFLATVDFLMRNDADRIAALKRDLASFGHALRRAADGHADLVVEPKTRVEHTLRGIIARTERVGATENQDAMVEEPRIRLELAPADVDQYIAADAVFKAVGDQDPMQYWKSAPYLAHFMQGYKVNERLTETLKRSPEKIAKILNGHDGAFLKSGALKRWSVLDPAHAKLRELMHELLDTGLWKLLWIPPTVPYWPLSGAFEGQEGRTKSLLFSAWNVVPDVVSAVLSYEAERRMVGGQMASYLDPDKQQRPLLRLARATDGSLSRHRLLLLLLPCLTLADAAHPLAAPPGADRRLWVRQRIEHLLADPRLPDVQDGPVDERWEWAIPLLLDPALRTFLATWRDADPKQMDKPNPEVLPSYIDDYLGLDPTRLGRRPDGLVDLLTDVALGAPGVLAARTLKSAGIDVETRRAHATQLASAFWKLFNRPAVIKLLLQLEEDGASSRDDGAYWRQVLRYCADGNLQAVLDETWHIAWEQHAWSEKESAKEISERCIADITSAVEPRSSRVHAQLYRRNGSGTVDTEEMRLRTALALRLGHLRSDDETFTQDVVRAAFNSPFRPFVLASTSIGQEGLDFHPWCHRLVHWNLPGNPVDLEQREGRVHRYKGHAVRKNVAATYADGALKAWRIGDCLWETMFAQADDDARRNGESDLVPYWIAPGPCRVQRRVPMLPYTSEVEAFARLKRQLAAYRVVFGQPRQEELMALLERAEIAVDTLNQWAIDLSPTSFTKPVDRQRLLEYRAESVMNNSASSRATT